MTRLVLDSGGVSLLARHSKDAIARIRSLLREGMWPPLIPSVVLVECLQGHAGRDAQTNQFLKTCNVVEEVPEALARRAAQRRRLAKTGSAVDALVVALAEPDGTALRSALPRRLTPAQPGLDVRFLRGEMPLELRTHLAVGLHGSE